MNILVFDIETIPDIDSGHRLYDLADLEQNSAAELMFSMRRKETKGASDFLPHYLHKIVAISVLLKTSKGLNVWSLGGDDADERMLIRRFFDGIERYLPTLVSWNGGGFDLPVLHYRSLLHGVAAPRYWEHGEHDPGFRWNNYLGRYHHRHTDLMDVLSGYMPNARAPLDGIASMLGLPGKMGMRGDQVWEQYQQGNIAAIRNYCDIDVLNLYLIYLRYELIRGKLTEIAYQEYCDETAAVLKREDKPHLLAFLEKWRT